MKILIILIALFAALNLTATPFYYIALNADGSPQTNIVTMQSWPPNGSGFTTYGTNIIFGNITYTNLPNASGFFSNWLYPGYYRVSIPALNSGFYVNLLDSTNYASLAIYATNMAPTQTGGSGFGIITNYLGYTPATNAPATNTIAYVSAVSGITNASGNVTNLLVTMATNTIIYIP